jgi:Arc/MetJ family transcription regulator
MSWKDAVGSVLHRTTGYTLTRESPEPREEALRTATPRAAARARRERDEELRRELRQDGERREAERA